ncbi:deoxynucleoside triphosphate triphosphohydrolase SAMHD1 isoform X2 [Nilaparvata lugens]|uniref:deoxynucleoside triphosphate triphosphohydrolase SAMHD1 isoform X2 n=1 Tax=Nilaparvata lugens TaxID=108931 RepID=UPI00193D757D|nr:deoxynucleoside triphosphate triphosphohydrolase SAMHD1 isoform X2 [Nilaparvata lugens]
MEVEKVFNDCVHGHIRLHPLCAKVIDTPQFQRLRNIKQLGFGYYVYPGAGHNRFEHSLGVCHLAGLMLEAVVANTQAAHKWGMSDVTACYSSDVTVTAEDKLCVQLAGLCHDLGHGPFSHTWEQTVVSCGRKWQHETASTEMFDHLIEDNNLIGEFDRYGIDDTGRKLIKELIMGEGHILPDSKRFLYQIVANKENDIDVDKWDYFLRDGLQLNILITFDYRRLLEFCLLIDVPDGEEEDEEKEGGKKKTKRVIAFKDKEKYSVLDIFRVRADLHLRAYQHPVVKNIDLMWKDAIILANEVYKIPTDNGEELNLLDAHTDIKTFAKLTDHIFYDIYNSMDPKLAPAQAILKRILKRQLYTYIGSYKVLKRPDEPLAAVKRRADSILTAVNSDLRCCLVKIDFGHHTNPLSKVVLYDGKHRRKPHEAPLLYGADDFPIKLSLPPVKLNVYSTKSQLTDEEISTLNNAIKSAIGFHPEMNGQSPSSQTGIIH